MSSVKFLSSLCLLIAIAIGVVHASELASNEPLVNVEATHHKIGIRDFMFSPLSVSIKQGDKITWANSDITPHTATALDGSWDTGLLKKGDSYSLIVTVGMDLNYYCKFHPMMAASLLWGQ